MFSPQVLHNTKIVACFALVAALLLPVTPTANAQSVSLGGYVDRITSDGFVIGWACDTKNPAAGNTTPVESDVMVQIQIDQTIVGVAPTNLLRTDTTGVCQQNGGGYNGFSFELPHFLKDGRAHLVYVRAGYSLNTQTSTGLNLGASPKSMTLNYVQPINAEGFFDSINTQSLVTTGWAFDRNDLNAPVSIRYTLDDTENGPGKPLNSELIKRYVRSDVNTNFGINGTFGYNYSLMGNESLFDNKIHILSSYAKDVGNGQDPVLIGKQSSLFGTLYNGYYDSLNNNTGILNGWAINKAYNSDAENRIEIYIDQETTPYTPTKKVYRPDVNQTFNVQGNYGFEFQVPDKYFDGAYHFVQIVGVSRDGSVRTDLGSKTLNIANANPQGYLERIDEKGTAYGWSFDPSASTQNLEIHYYMDGPAGLGKLIAINTANQPRSDVNSTLGVTGDHGFSYQIPSTYFDGKGHTLYAYAINVGNGQHTLLGSQSFAKNI
jgi:hypothetical protein